MSDFGGIVTFFIEGDLANTRVFLENCEIFALAESPVGHPPIRTHASMPPERRTELGILDQLIRLSVGFEDGDDLIAYLDQPLVASRE